MLNACVLLALVLTLANSEQLDKPVAREAANGENLGFISIDCGSNVDYLQEDTGIWYKKDEGFVETGENHRTSSTVNLNYDYFGRQLNTLRCFPKGDRNCYTLKPKQGKNNKYLIRAFFSYGNYDGKNQTRSFELHLGVNLWQQVNISITINYHFTEIIHTPTTDDIHVCLVKTGSTIPCISSLELRLLNNSIYQHHEVTSNNAPQPLLKYQGRFGIGSLGSSSRKHYRYKDDVYDRMWLQDSRFINTNGWNPLDLEESTNGWNPKTNNDAYKLPAQVLRRTAQLLNVSSPLQFVYNQMYVPLDNTYEYCVYFHFNEIQQLPEGQKREINITLNYKPVLPNPLVLEYLKPVTHDYKTQGDVWFNISTATSDFSPILNAFEIYQLITQLDSPTYAGDVGAIQDIKSVYQISKLSWQGDPCLPKQYAWEGLVCTADTIPRITSLDLSSSKLTGEINISFSYLTELESLDLSNNELEGPIPEFLLQLPKLKLLNLTGNKLSGSIPKALKEKPDFQLSVADNPDLCTVDSCKKKSFPVPLVASISTLIVILLLSFGFWIFTKQKVIRVGFEKRGSLKSKYRAFSYTEILNITDNFKTIIGEGGFGKVYVGTIQGETQVAVKMLSESSTQGYKEFQSEAQLLMIVHHRNLVSLIGYCNEGEIKALVYDYMVNGNLQQHLSVGNGTVLNWNERLNIAVDAAHGLDYLHNGCKPPIIHRDLKPSNILLDENMHAKIADFGLSRAFGNDNDSHISTRPAGTLGYVDPEFHRTSNTNKKNDIYSFGIILFQLITGRQAIVRALGENSHILQWVIPLIEGGDIQNVIDPRLQGEFSINSACKFVEIAMSCISQTINERPDMSQIFVELKECLSLDMDQRGGERARNAPKFEFSSLQIGSEITPSAR